MMSNAFPGLNLESLASYQATSPEPRLTLPVLACSRLVTEIKAAESLVLRGGALRHQYPQFLRPPRPRRARRAHA